MANAARSLRLASVLAFLALSESRSTQAPPQPVTRFRAVEGYSLSITVTSDDDMKATDRSGDPQQMKLKEKFVAHIDLKERHLDNDYVEWLGEGIAEQELEETRKEVHTGGNFVQEIKAVGKGKSKTKAKLYIDELKKTFQVMIDTEYITVPQSGYRKDLGQPTEQISGDTSLITTGLYWLAEYPLPGAGLGLLVDKAYPKEQCGDYLSDLETAKVHFSHPHIGRLQMDLVPLGAKEPKLILTPPDDYSTWRPKPPLTPLPETSQPPVNVAALDSGMFPLKSLLQIQYRNFLPIALQSLGAQQLRLDPGLFRPNLWPFDVGWEIVLAGSKSKVVKVTFLLTDVSHYPGVCMNWPATAEADPRPDLEFVPPMNQTDLILDEKRQTLTIYGATAQSGSGTVRLGTRDGAAIGVLNAQAQLEDGRVLIAEIKGRTGSHRLLIPDRDEGVSEIAKHWRKERAGDRKDEDDDEEEPKGDGQVGDGLTVWEEYRGFFQGGQWRDDCYPKKKDLFIENKVGADAKAGIELFRKITGLSVHDQLAERERKSNRVINFNKRSDRWIADQHCLVLRASMDPTVGMAEGDWITELTGSPLGPPKNTEWVNVVMNLSQDDSYYDPDTREFVTRNLQSKHIAHELSHAIGVQHHGDKDVFGGVQWSWRPSAPLSSTPRQIYEQLVIPITVVREQGLSVMTIEELFRSGTKRTVWVGRRSGQHSGNVDCVMRYCVAQAYENASTPSGRIWHGGDEPPGDSLCESGAGTRFNYLTHVPQSRYGPADAGRGNCIQQFVISDKWNGPRRP